MGKNKRLKFIRKIFLFSNFMVYNISLVLAMEKDNNPQITIDLVQVVPHRRSKNRFLEEREDFNLSLKRSHQQAFSALEEEGHVEHLISSQDANITNTKGEELLEQISNISAITCAPSFQGHLEYEKKVSEEKDELIGENISYIGRKGIIWEDDWWITDKVTPVGLRVHNFSQVLYRDATQKRNIPLENEDIIPSDVLGILHVLASKILALGETKSDFIFGNIPNTLVARISFILKRGQGQARYIPAGYLWLSDEDEPEPDNSATVLTSGSKREVYPFLTLDGLERYYHRYKEHHTHNELPTIRLDAAGSHTEQGLLKRLMELKEKRDVIREKLNKAIEVYAKLERTSSRENCSPSKKQKESASEEALILYLISGREICSNREKGKKPKYYNSCYHELIEKLRPFLAEYIPNVILCFSYNNRLEDASIIRSSTERNYYLHSITELGKLGPIICRHAVWELYRLHRDVTILPPHEEENKSFKRYQLLIKLKKGVEESSYPCLSLEEWRIIKDDFKVYSQDDSLKYQGDSPFLPCLISLGTQGNIHAQYLIAKGYFACRLPQAEKQFLSIHRLRNWDRRNEDVMERNIVSKHENIIKWSLEWYKYHAGKHWLTIRFNVNKEEQKYFRKLNIICDEVEIRLGQIYEHGWGTQKNLHKSEKCYTRAYKEASKDSKLKNEALMGLERIKKEKTLI